jgi:hypothetical protein
MKASASQNEVLSRQREKSKRWVMAEAAHDPSRRVLLTFASQLAAARDLAEEGAGKVLEIDGDQWFQLGGRYD